VLRGEYVALLLCAYHKFFDLPEALAESGAAARDPDASHVEIQLRSLSQPQVLIKRDPALLSLAGLRVLLHVLHCRWRRFLLLGRLLDRNLLPIALSTHTTRTHHCQKPTADNPPADSSSSEPPGQLAPGYLALSILVLVCCWYRKLDLLLRLLVFVLECRLIKSIADNQSFNQCHQTADLQLRAASSENSARCSRGEPISGAFFGEGDHIRVFFLAEAVEGVAMKPRPDACHNN
jgi:hypothetical protein